MEAAGVEPASTTIFTSGTTCLSSIKRFAVFFLLAGSKQLFCLWVNLRLNRINTWNCLA